MHRGDQSDGSACPDAGSQQRSGPAWAGPDVSPDPSRLLLAHLATDEGVVPCPAEATIETAAVQAVVAGVGEEAIARVSAEEPVAACPSS